MDAGDFASHIRVSRMFTGSEWLENKVIRVSRGRIESIDDDDTFPNDQFHNPNIVVPGFIDLQVYGGQGILFSNHQTVEAIHATFREHSKTGTVGFQIAINCNSPTAMWKAVDACRSYILSDGKGLVGLHLEGPFFSPSKRGAHKAEFVQKPSVDFIKELIIRCSGVPTYLTIAPEMFNDEELDLLLRSEIKLSIGHSDANYDCAIDAINKGANRVTHLFNAMSQWQSRALGVVGAALDSPNCWASVIADGLHVDFKSISLAAKLKPGRLFLITDAVTHDTTGPYSFLRTDKTPPYFTDDTGVLAGSALTMDRAVFNVTRYSGIQLDEALRMASLYPAIAAKLDGDLGSISVGKRACLVELNSELEVLRVWYDGRELNSESRASGCTTAIHPKSATHMFTPTLTLMITLVTLLSLFGLSFASAAVPNEGLQRTWSNRLGTTLSPVSTGVWAAERPFTWNNIDVGGRSVVCRMPKAGDENVGKLVIHSPVEWTQSLGDSISALGEVGALVAPNYEHLKYIEQWASIYPKAQIWACPGLPSRLPKVRWTHELSSDSSNAPLGLKAIWMDCEINPFTGRPFFNECVFLHELTKTLLITDAFWNYPKSDRPNYDGESGTGKVHQCPRTPLIEKTLPPVAVPSGTKLWKFGMDKVYLPFYKNIMVGRFGHRRERYNKIIDEMLSWDVEVIAPCHGDLIRGKELCSKVLAEHFAL